MLDDWGLTPLTDADRRELLELLEDRHELRSTLVTSQLPVEKWYDAIGHPTLADAILDPERCRVHSRAPPILRPQ